MTRTLRINRDRLWACLMELKEIGAYDDEATGLPGVRRLALTDADAQARRRCVDWMREAGLEVRVDRIGNVDATRPGRIRSVPPPSRPGTTPAWSARPSWLRHAGCATAATSGSSVPPWGTSTSAAARPMS